MMHRLLARCNAFLPAAQEAADSVDSPPLYSRTLNPKKPTMTIEIRDAPLEARIQKQLQATGSSSVEEVLLRLLDTQEEQDRWLVEVRLARAEKPR
jgi:hypothetical protein